MNRELAKPQLSLKLGSAGEKVRVEFSDSELATHMAIYGGTGKGKSKLLELILRQIIEQRAGACIIDPHGDLVEDLMAFLLERYDCRHPSIAERIHYFEPGSNTCRFRFDPFHYSPMCGESYEDWLKAKVESVARTIIRKQGEAGFEGKPRLERFLTNVLYACGMRVNETGDHLGLGDALILLDPSHPLHGAAYSKIAPHLSSEIRSDFEKIRRSNPRQQEDWVESTINRLRSFLSPAVRSLFCGPSRESLDFHKIVQSQGVMLVNLRRTRSFTIDQGNAIGGLFINEILEAAQITSRTARRPYFLFIDEASRFVGQDLMDALAQFRKMKLSLCLAVQDLSSLKLRDIDMTAKVISQCGIHVTFQQKYPEDLEVLGQLFGYPLLDFSPLRHEVDRPDGYEWVDVESITTGTSSTETSSDSRSVGSSRSQTTSDSESSSVTRGIDFQQRSTSDSTGKNRGESRSDQEGRTQGFSVAKGENQSITRSKTPLAKHRVEIQETGRLRRSVDDQFHQIKQSLRMLGKGQAVVAVDGSKPFLLDVDHVEMPFPAIDDERRLNLVDGFKRHLGKLQPYSFKPSDTDGEQERVGRFIGEKPPETGFSVFDV